MTPLVLVVNLCLSFAGLAALCLSMNRHHAQAFIGKPTRRRALTLRVAGWSGIAASFAVAVLWEGWNFGPVQWLGALSGAALLVVGLVSYRPGWIRPAALVALPLALIVAFAV